MNAREFLEQYKPSATDTNDIAIGIKNSRVIKASEAMEAYLAHKIEEAGSKLDTRLSSKGFIDGYKEALKQLEG